MKLIGIALVCVLAGPAGCKAKDAGKNDDAKASGKKTESSGGDDPADGIDACADWRSKLAACEPLKKTSASLIEKTKDAWRLKKMSKSDIAEDCKKKIETLPRACR